IEIQIRTSDMDQVAETGIAAHWRYKEGSDTSNSRLAWVQELLEFNQNMESSDIMDVVKNDLDIGGVFAFTPNGDVRELRYGATPLDFAYAIHTEIGNHCVGAKVNGKIVPLKYRLKSGDTVEILTSSNQTPSKNWLDIVKTGRAKTRIRQWLARIYRENNKNAGKEVFEKTLKVLAISLGSLKKEGNLDKMIKAFNISSEDDFYSLVGVGKITAKQIVEELSSLVKKVNKGLDEQIEKIDEFSGILKKDTKKRYNQENIINVDGMKDIMIRKAKCCNPIPGDDIVGHITSGRGVTVHTANCKRVQRNDSQRKVEVEWNSTSRLKHSVNIRITAHDRPGILSLISKTINNTGVNIKSAFAKSLPDSHGDFVFGIEVYDYNELSKAIESVKELEEVISVNRI
ncbi:MAG: TGS domain-containing protein, partial [Halobacteriovoraceae bacterium]|nr:TGS domain-containing protein [Halobacteriovoraceae bacterium]